MPDTEGLSVEVKRVRGNRWRTKIFYAWR